MNKEKKEKLIKISNEWCIKNHNKFNLTEKEAIEVFK